MIGRAAPLLALLLAGCLPGGTQREEQAAPHDPARPTVVSLNPCTDAVLARIAPAGQILALSHYSRDPASSSMDPATARRFRATGGTLEEILALRPDMVVAGSYLSPALAEGLADAGIRLVTYPMPASIAQSEDQVRDLARLTGNVEGGQELAREIEEAVARAGRVRADTPVPALVWETGGIVAGDGTLIADLLAHAGFANAAAARGLGQAQYLPLESVVADPPRVVFTVASPAGEEDRLLRHPALRDLPGMTRVPLDPGLLWCGGPTIARALARLAAVREGMAP